MPENLWDSDDPAVRARVRGRAITAALARQVDWSPDFVLPRLATGDRDAWAFYVDPSGGWREPTRPAPRRVRHLAPATELEIRARDGDR